MIDQAVAAVAIEDKVLVEIGLLRADGCMGRAWFIAALCIGVCCLPLACQRLTPASLLLIFAQSLVIAFLVASHHAGQVVHTAAHIPLENRTTALWIDIHILLVTFDKQFIL